MSGVWVQILQFLAALSLLIVLHEGGHFFFARLFKTRVEKFYLFFDFLFPFSGILNFSLFRKKIGDTEYGIGWFPMGGYVKIAGMVDESMDTEQMQRPPEPWEFRSKKAWQRLLIMLGGIIVNVLLAYVIFIGMAWKWGEEKLPIAQMHYGIENADSFTYKLGFRDGDIPVAINGKQYEYYQDFKSELIYANTVTVERKGTMETIQIPEDFLGKLSDNQIKGILIVPFPAIVDSVLPRSGGAAAGLQKGDRILKVNDDSTITFMQFRNKIQELKKQRATLTIDRNGTLQQLQAQVSDTGTLGIMIPPAGESVLEKTMGYHFTHLHYGFLDGISAGISKTNNMFYQYVRQFKKIFDYKTGAYKGVGSFISIAQVFPKVWDWQIFWGLTAFLSVALAIMNLLPIPGLDGGYVFITLAEMITGKKMSDKAMGIITTIGLFILLGLMVVLVGKDIFRLFR